MKLAGHYNDGSERLLCSCCEKDGGVSHQCSFDGVFAQPRWLPLVLAGIGIVCPNCKAAYDLGVKIEPKNPEAAEALKAAGLFFGGLILFKVVVEILQDEKGKKGRR
ncbi:MAG: hypothetical protein DMF64_00165 [Acidobacteria bacterium]|nr:MAG: hypothetical protein DMF64_00165 [Acidobacteriota bacterium]